ncbi:MAG: glycosyltransferase family 9 protein [bacterium]|nr:glycosyltransferase family 9 protein [bacterium]
MDKVLIVRLSAIGDLVMASPLIGAFKRTWPQARLTWLVEETSKAVLEANPGLDEIIVWPRARWRKLLRDRRYLTLLKEIRSFVAELRKRRFDLAVDAQGLLKSGIWVWLSGARERVGIGSREGSRFLMTEVISREGASDGLSSQYLLLAEALGLETEPFEMEMALSDDAEKYARQFKRSIGSEYIVFAPFTTRPQKHWIQKRWPKVAHHLFCELGLKTVILGGWGDVEAADRMVENASGIINLAGKTSLQQAGAVIARSSLLIGVDTGLTHMGIALEVPTIALFGATRPYLDTTGTSGEVLYHKLDCSPCRRSPTCDGDFTCMKAISAEEVIRTARRLLTAP